MKLAFLIPALLFCLSAQAQTKRNTTQTNETEATTPMDLKDTQITKVLLTLNEGEIKAGEMAVKKAKNPEVKEFAEMMVKAHKENAAETKSLARAQKLDPRDSQMAMRLMDDAKMSNRKLRASEKKKDFDKTYITEQIMMHEKALSTLDDSLIPQAHNASLRDHLQKTRSAVAQHLEHAKSLQTKFQ